MSKLKFYGKPSYIIRSYICLMAIGLKTTIKHLLNKPLVASWSISTEVGILFWRHQFNHAFKLDDIKQAREYFDSLQTQTNEIYKVDIKPNAVNTPVGDWLIPETNTHKITILYLHGGGYAFRSKISFRYAQMLSHHLSMPLFMPHYRLTPENPHPAQLEDALIAYKYLLAKNISPSNIVIIGDSAGGHLTLMLLQALKQQNIAQPQLAIALCAWVDMAAHGKSFFENDKYDLVQGYMALKFGQWLKGGGNYSDKQLSPIYQDYKGLAPIYLQAGEKECFIDMNKDFYKILKQQGADVSLDTWPDMTHNFQANGNRLPQSRQALKHMLLKILHYSKNSID